MKHGKQTSSKSRKRYSIEFKLDVIRQAKDAKNRAVIARQFNVPEQTLCNWLKAYSEGVLQPPLKPEYSPEEIEFLERVQKLKPEYRFELDRTLKSLLRLQGKEN